MRPHIAGQSKRRAGATDHSPWPIRAAIIGAIATLIATLGSLYFSGQAVRQSTEQARQAQVQLTSERISRSVEQLGSDSVAVRLGGVYSFARLLRDAPGDHEAVVEILSALVRVQAGETSHPQKQARKPVPADILAALQVLSNQPLPRPETELGPLPTMLLDGVDFSGFNLGDVELHEATLIHANLASADLTSANLAGAHLNDADMTHAILQAANLRGASLLGADLSGATLGDSHLDGADLDGADLAGADLTFAYLHGATLFAAHLAGADLAGADLNGADLTGADLRNVNLRDTSLVGAIGLDSACSNQTTLWPDTISLPARPRCSP
ncbi:pentapeptide repeat-containing protein [Kribbella sp. NBC_01510]|uniref:pentapeptide repeat-containing protein n=1 Tax=Kribbella sp. NBC_01510 TaxID=2903581 RepID=UPI003863568C